MNDKIMNEPTQEQIESAAIELVNGGLRGWSLWNDTERYLAREMAKNHLAKLAAAEKERDEWKEKAESVVALEELHLTPRGMEMRLKENPAMAHWTAQCFAEIVAHAPNYTECQFSMDRAAMVNGKPIIFTVTVQKVEGKTPHQMRQLAEKERDELRSRIAELEARAAGSELLARVKGYEEALRKIADSGDISYLVEIAQQALAAKGGAV